jgi:hypothetical protein
LLTLLADRSIIELISDIQDTADIFTDLENDTPTKKAKTSNRQSPEAVDIPDTPSFQSVEEPDTLSSPTAEEPDTMSSPSAEEPDTQSSQSGEVPNILTSQTVDIELTAEGKIKSRCLTICQLMLENTYEVKLILIF